jgi:hypothetical protein
VREDRRAIAGEMLRELNPVAAHVILQKPTCMKK